MTKATHKKTRVDIMKSQKRQQKKAYGLGRQNLTGYTDVAGGFTTMHQVSTASSGGANQTFMGNAVGAINFLDPIAFWMDIKLIYPEDPEDTLDLGPSGAYTSHWVWAAAGSKELEIITNNDPDTAFSGQILFIESVDTETPKIVDRSNTSGGDTGNIKTLDGEDFTFPSNKTIVLFMFSSIDNLWHQVSNPVAGISLSEDNRWTGEQQFDDIQINTGGGGFGGGGGTTTAPLDLTPPITGTARFGGYITIKDSGGTERKVPYL